MPKPANRIGRVLDVFGSTVWAMEEQALTAMMEVLDLRTRGLAFTDDEVAERLAAARHGSGAIGSMIPGDSDEPHGPVTHQGVRIIPVHGVIAPRMDLMMRVSGGTSTQQVATWFREALADDKVRAIVLEYDTPGGDARGNEELANLIRESRGRKPIVAVATNLCASAGYYCASAADEIVVAPSAEIGSIGTVLAHGEVSRREQNDGVTWTVIRYGENKALGSTVEPLGDKGKASLQERVDAYGQQFVEAVAKSRGVTVEHVQENFGQGKVVIAAKAVELGMADRVGTLEQVVRELAGGRSARSNTGSGGASTRNEVSEKESAMDKKIVQALVAVSLVTVGASDEECQKVLDELYAFLDREQPKDADEVVKDVERLASVLPKPKSGDGKPVETDEGASSGAGTGGGGRVNESELRSRERARIDDLHARGQLLDMSDEAIRAAIGDELSVEAALRKWTDDMASANGSVSTGRDARVTEAGEDRFATAALEALEHQCGIAAADAKLSAHARDLQYASLLDLATISLEQGGTRVRGMLPDDIAAMALQGPELRVGAAEQAYQRPGDLPIVFSNLAGRVRDQAMEFAPSTYRMWASQFRSVPDFKPATIVRTGEFSEFPRVPDGDDFEQDDIGEEASWIAADSYGKEWALTPRMFVDNDLGAFQDAVQDNQIAHELTLNRLCIDLLTGNAAASDGKALYHTDHGNDRAAGNSPSTTELSEMRKLLRKQVGVGQRRTLSLTLRRLLIPTDLETTTQQLLAATLNIVPETESNAQIFRGQVAYDVDPMLDDASTQVYYGFGDPRIARAIRFTFQRGYERMRVRNYFNPKNNSRVWQFEGRFAAAIDNWRGTVRNAGTGAS